jgi:hypothetical protein
MAPGSLSDFGNVSRLADMCVSHLVAVHREEVISWNPRAFVYHNFITEEEAEYIKTLAKPMVRLPCSHLQVMDAREG